MDRQRKIADMDTKYLWKELEMEMSTSDNIYGQGLQYMLACSDCDTIFFFPKLVSWYLPLSTVVAWHTKYAQ